MVTSAPAPQSPSWLRVAAGRLGYRWRAKTIGLALGMAAFFRLYFLVLHHPPRPPAIMPLTPLDHAIAFQSTSLPLYLSLWPYLCLAPGLMTSRRELLNFFAAAIALSAVGLGIFLAWPTAVPPPTETWTEHSLFAFLKHADASGNACPSLHAAFAVFTAIALGRQLRGLSAGRLARAVNWAWCAGILYSTLATRQHVALDMAAGAALGGVIALAFGCGRSRSDPVQIPSS